MAATFFARYETGLRRTATGALVAGRLQGALSVSLTDLEDPGVQSPGTAAFELFGPGDVERLGPGAVTRRFPAPGAGDAEESKLALVELAAPDLPWRYTPRVAAGAVLRPWLVLVVGRRAPDELTVRPDGRVTLGPLTQQRHPLGQSALWAHVHEVDTRAVARIVCPADLASDTAYVACLVPAFDAAGGDAWTGADAVAVDCYDRWSFRTGPQGDFPDLAARLHRADLAAVGAAGGRPFGRAQVRYDRRGPGEPASFLLEAAGALRLPVDPVVGPDPADAAPNPVVAAEVQRLSDRVVLPDGRSVVSAPDYPAPFVEPGSGASAGGWREQAGADPRTRGAAGLGAWAAVVWQDRIADAAAVKAGDLAIARGRVAHVALGVEVSRSLWRRRLPAPEAAADPAAAREASLARLAVLAPCLGRLPTDTHETVLDRVARRTPALSRAVLSSAARRALRPGPARTALARPGAGRPGLVLDAANTCARDARDPTAVENTDPDFDDAMRGVERAVRAASGDDQESADRVLQRFGGGLPLPMQLVAALVALVPGRDGRPDPDVLSEYLDIGDFSDEQPASLPDLPRQVTEAAPAAPCRPLDLDGLATAVADAVDPTVDRPLVVDRVLATLPGLTHVGPVELEPELDLPLWSFLSEQAPDWMLAGAGDLPEHAVVGLATNPAFVQALLVGANHQVTGELRWRGVPLLSRWSPLRKFWQRAGGALDIASIRSWPAEQPLGSSALADAVPGEEAVVAFRTPLFRRYPDTVVYLYPRTGDWDPPPDGVPLQPPPVRVDPTFSGTIGEDITFFGFRVPPATLRDHWVVLEEPPAGYRFYHSDAVPPPGPGLPDDHSASYAFNRFALPVRVLIGPLL